MRPLSEFTKDTILAEETFIEAFESSDPVKRVRRIVELRRRAKELGVKNDFEDILKGYNQAEREMKREERDNRPATMLNNYTNFSGDYPRMYCGAWIASDDGILYCSGQGGQEERACYHPVLPLERMKNLQTGEEQIRIAYMRNHSWTEIVVPKTLIASANKIVSLSAYGISVTSENAKLLVKYLSDVENGNEDHIPIQMSTSKLGWHEKDFIPYDQKIIFDGDNRFRHVFESIKERGSYDKWLTHIKELRATGRIEIKFLLAASFSSVLVSLVGGLPFIVDLWGETEGGKTVSEMVAASVWANPAEHSYIGDFKSTEVALETKADMLNHLPMILDDTSKISARIKENMEGFVYDLCSGKGKSRSNKELGVNRENRWQNVILTNGERPLNSYVKQGGAINRILEVECKTNVFADPRHTADIVRKNYGHAGKKFVEIIKEKGIDFVQAIQAEYLNELSDDEKMQKQSISLSIVLTADKIINDHIFMDGCTISAEEARSVLIDREMVSDNERCYAYLIDKISMNGHRFDTTTVGEKWGVVEDEYAVIYATAFTELCQSGGFSRTSFLSWADREGIIKTSSGRYDKPKKISGKVSRCVFLKLDRSDGFEEMTDLQGKLPFDIE